MDCEGTQRTGHTFQTSGTSSTMISYADLGGAFVEIGHYPREHQRMVVCDGQGESHLGGSVGPTLARLRSKLELPFRGLVCSFSEISCQRLIRYLDRSGSAFYRSSRLRLLATPPIFE